MAQMSTTTTSDTEGIEDMERRRLQPSPEPLAPVEGSEPNRNENRRNVTAGSGNGSIVAEGNNVRENGNGNTPSERTRNENGNNVVPTLEQRIAACLQGGDIGADQLAELIAETREAVATASIAAEAARARAYDPAIVDRRARRDMEQSDHLARRLRLALPQLHGKLAKLHNAAEYREWLTDFELI